MGRVIELTEGGGDRAYHHGDLRSALIAAAEIELSDVGFEDFSLRACARRAGVSHTAPKHHFGNADGLLAAVATRGFQQLTQVMDRHMTDAPSGRDRLIAAGCGYVAFAEDHPTLFKLMFSEWAKKQDSDELHAAQAAAFDVLRHAAAEAHPTSEPETAMLGIITAWAVVHGLSHLLIEGAKPLTELGSREARRALIVGVLQQVAHRTG